MRRNVLLDLDDTLYVCDDGAQAGKRAVSAAVAKELGISEGEVGAAWDRARHAVKERIDGRGSSHSRLLYLSELVQAEGHVHALPHVRGWERLYWRAYLGATKLRPRVLPFLDRVHAAGGRVAIVTDLTLEVQLWKLEAFGLFTKVDALAVSEEVANDKPDVALFELGIKRIGTTAEHCIVMGDRSDRDGEGARRLGTPYVEVPESDVDGTSFDRALAEMGIA